MTGQAGFGRRIGVLLIAAGLLALASAPAALGADRIYWGNGDNDTISYANLDGTGGGGELNLTGATPSGPRGVAIDAAAGRIYWANQGNDTISYANLDGSGGGGQVNITGAPAAQPHGLAIDPGAGRIYWANSDNTIAYANLDGSGGAPLDTSGATPSDPYGTVIDPATGRIYWANRVTYTISYANLDGSGGGGELDVSGAPIIKPHGVTIDPATGRIYWTNLDSTIGYANIDDSGGGGKLETPGANDKGAIGMAIDPSLGRMWWGNLGNDTISWANLDGSGGGVLDITPATASAPRFVAILRAPSGTGAPQIAGGSTPGSVLSCSQATWAPDVLPSFLYRAPQSVAYQWTRDGADIAGATDTSYTAYAPGDYRCRATATNAAGSTSQTSDPHAMPGPPETELTGTKMNLRRQKVRFGFEAVGAASGFLCKLNRPHRPATTLKGCGSPKIYKHLRPGRYLFLVRAFGPGGLDPTPARKRLRIR
jgi:hypothetical protein